MQNGKKEITVSAKVDNLPEVMEFIDGYLEDNEISPKVQMQMDIATDELFSNIANYAYGEESGEAIVSIEITDNPATVEIVFKDFGTPFNPLDKEDPDVTLSAEEREIGGLGIFMVKKSMDEMKYEYADGMNILKINKNI